MSIPSALRTWSLQQHDICVCVITVTELPDRNTIFGPCRDSVIHLHKQMTQTHEVINTLQRHNHPVYIFEEIYE